MKSDNPTTNNEMKTITLETAFEILETASAVILNDDVTLYPGLADLTGEDDNAFMLLSWENEKGNECCLRFCEGDNREIEQKGDFLFLFAGDGEKTKVMVM
jgi:hypothetical protein